MAEGNTKTKDSTTVRIWTEPKKKLQDVVRAMAAKEKRDVTEQELASKAVEEFYDRKKKALGL